MFYEKTNQWEALTQAQSKRLWQLAEDYKNFLNAAKTERLANDQILQMAKKAGYISLEEAVRKRRVRRGDKIYLDQKGKASVLMVLGEDLEEGMDIVGSHIDVPRLDLKPMPLYEEGNMALLKTHYYGGVKKYQWTAIPLALHGVVFTKDGGRVNVSIGEKPEDPVFYINDLLIHLSADQMKKALSEGISAEQLNVVFGHIPEKKQKDQPVKAAVLKLLKEMYGMEEEDFLSAELEIVPAGPARDVGVDRAMICGHGHDDRVSAYASLCALLEIKKPKRTAVCIFADKEEVGSVGNTGMESKYFENMVAEILALNAKGELAVRRSLARSRVISADVTACFDPSFPEVTEKFNVAHAGCGIVMSKYTGVRGKSGSNDANAEFISELRRLFAKNKVVWQSGELGKVDQGGGGTIAYILANSGAEVVDMGVPVLSMHAPFELISKADLYSAYMAYKAFLQ